MSRTYRSDKRPWQWPGWALNLFVQRPMRRKLRREDRQILRATDIEAVDYTRRIDPKTYWD